MKKALKIVKILLISIVALWAVLLIAVQVILSEDVLRRIVVDNTTELFDGDFTFEHADVSVFRSFPRLQLQLTGVSLTYPHDKFPQAGGLVEPGETRISRMNAAMMNAGRGAVRDTLCSLNNLTISVGYLPLLKGSLNLHELTLARPRIYAHKYDSTAANWNILRFLESESESDTTSTELSIPEITVDKIILEDRPWVVYTSPSDTLFASLAFKRFNFSGSFEGDGLIPIITDSRFKLGIDSLAVSGRMPYDTLDVNLDRLRLALKKRYLTADLKARTHAATAMFGRVEVPVSLDARVNLPRTKSADEIDAEIGKLNLNVAQLPLSVTGQVRLLPDSTYTNLRLDVKDCPVHEIYNSYAAPLLESVPDIDLHSSLTLWATAKGWYVAETETLPRIDAGITDLAIKGEGINVKASAAAWDALADDPQFDLDADVDASLSQVMHYVPRSLGIHASGDVCLQAKANKMRLSQASLSNFSNADLKAALDLDRFKFSMPADSLDAYAGCLTFKVASAEGAKGVGANLHADSLAVGIGETVAHLVGPDINFRNSEKSLSLDIHPVSARVAFDKARVSVPGTRAVAAKVAAGLSLERRNPNQPEHRGRKRFRPRPKTDDDFKEGDVDIHLDKSITKYLQDWTATGTLNIGWVGVMSSLFPLRTSLSRVDATFTENEVNINSLKLRSGKSNLSLNGSLAGIRKALIDKGYLRLNLNANSDCLNINELLAAANASSSSSAPAPEVSESMTDEEFEDVVTSETIDASEPVSALIIIPANVRMNVNLKASNVTYSDFEIKSFKSKIVGKGRCVQLTDTQIETNLGNIGLDAFYYTKNKKDIGAGFDLAVHDVFAEQVIQMFPAIDTIMPMLKSFEGKLDLEMAATTQLDTTMTPVPSSLNGAFTIQGKDLTLRELGPMRKFARLLLFRDSSKGQIDSLKVCGIVEDSKLEIFPFLLKVDRYSLALNGKQSFDQSFDYDVSVIKWPLLIQFGVNLNGPDFDNIKFKLRGAKYHKESMPPYEEKVNEYKENLIHSIRNVFTTGADKALSENRNSALLSQEFRSDMEKQYADTSMAVPASIQARLDSLQAEPAAADTLKKITKKDARQTD